MSLTRYWQLFMYLLGIPMMVALASGGVALIYGPFLRDGRATSEGDRAFDASLRAQDPSIGYKDAGWVSSRLSLAGLGMAEEREMPANNLALVFMKA